MKKNDIKYSIIVAAYNVSDYIDECLQSILNNEGSYEVIIVNDGSSDDTLDKINKYKSNNVRVFTTNHVGLAEVRNFGIEHAYGEYIMFIDGDDKFTANFLQTINSQIDNCDLCVFSWEPINENSIVTGKAIIVNDFWTMDRMAWNKVYKRSLIKELRFPAGVLYEDVGFTSIAYLTANNIKFINTPLYQYRQRRSSITHIKQKASDHLGILAGLDDVNEWQREYGDKESKIEIQNLNYRIILSHVKRILIDNEYKQNNEEWVLIKLVQYFESVEAKPKKGTIRLLVRVRNRFAIALIEKDKLKLARKLFLVKNSL